MKRGVIALDLGGTNPRISFLRDNKIVIKKDYNKEIDYDENIENFIGTLKSEKIIKTKKEFVIVNSIAGFFNNTIKSKTVEYINKIKLKSNKDYYFINDFEAIAYGIVWAKNNKSNVMKKINKVTNRNNNNRISVIGPGTGLGMANIYYDNKKSIILSSEGGHSHFYPKDFGFLYEFLLRKYELEYNNKNIVLEKEDFVSGRGLRNILDFLLFSPDHVRYVLEKRPEFIINESVGDERLKEEFNKEIMYNKRGLKQIVDVGKTISKLFYKNQKAHIVLRLMTEFLGEIAQDIALNLIPNGGIYIAGGIMMKNDYVFEFNDFNRGFFNNNSKGTIEILNNIPLYLIRDYDISLYGAYEYARTIGK